MAGIKDDTKDHIEHEVRCNPFQCVIWNSLLPTSVSVKLLDTEITGTTFMCNTATGLCEPV